MLICGAICKIIPELSLSYLDYQLWYTHSYGYRKMYNDHKGEDTIADNTDIKVGFLELV